MGFECRGIPDGDPGPRLDHLTGLRRRGLREPSPPIVVVSADRGHPLGMSVGHRGVSRHLDPGPESHARPIDGLGQRRPALSRLFVERDDDACRARAFHVARNSGVTRAGVANTPRTTVAAPSPVTSPPAKSAADLTQIASIGKIRSIVSPSSDGAGKEKGRFKVHSLHHLTLEAGLPTGVRQSVQSGRANAWK